LQATHSLITPARTEISRPRVIFLDTPASVGSLHLCSHAPTRASNEAARIQTLIGGAAECAASARSRWPERVGLQAIPKMKTHYPGEATHQSYLMLLLRRRLLCGIIVGLSCICRFRLHRPRNS
jgi:hypothetical protein